MVNWNLALDPSGGPHNNGCDTCTGVITVGPGQTVTRDAEYYTLGHLARFVRPGAVRIASTSFGTTGWNGQIMDAAFRNPDGSTALVVHNENDNPASFAVAQGDASFAYTLPGGALATFTWTASRRRTTGAAADRMTATATPPPGAGAPRRRRRRQHRRTTDRTASQALGRLGEVSRGPACSSSTLTDLPTTRAATQSRRVWTGPPGPPR
jgi:glucosylceramidase